MFCKNLLEATLKKLARKINDLFLNDMVYIYTLWVGCIACYCIMTYMHHRYLTYKLVNNLP